MTHLGAKVRLVGEAGQVWASRDTRPPVAGCADPSPGENAHVCGAGSQPRPRWRGRGARGLGVVVAVVVVGVVVVAWPHTQHFSQGLPPQQFRDELDPDLLKDYSGVLGVAHNAAN